MQYKRPCLSPVFQQLHHLPVFHFYSSEKQTHLQPSAMAYCGPSYAIPSCASSPVVGFGSAGLGYGGLHGPASGHVGWPTTSDSLGTLSGVIPSCINQIPPAEVVIQPPPVVLTIPGAILSATGQPVSVGGNTPCAISGGYGQGLYGPGMLGSCLRPRGSVILGRKGSICLPPC